MFLRSIPSPTQEPQICENCEVKFEVSCIYLVLNTLKKFALVEPSAGCVQCP